MAMFSRKEVKLIWLIMTSACVANRKTIIFTCLGVLPHLSHSSRDSPIPELEGKAWVNAGRPNGLSKGHLAQNCGLPIAVNVSNGLKPLRGVSQLQQLTDI